MSDDGDDIYVVPTLCPHCDLPRDHRGKHMYGSWTEGGVVHIGRKPITATVNVEAAAVAIKDLLQAFGVPESSHTDNTHNRSALAWEEMLAGYREDPADHLDVTFPAARDPGLVIVSGIKLQSMCAHHLLPFSGVATVAYRPSPGQQVVGLSKLARVITGYARRLQVQETIGYDTVNAIMDRLQPSGTAVVITASHDCMRLRGVREPGSVTTTMADAGLLQDHERALIQMAHSEHVRDL